MSAVGAPALALGLRREQEAGGRHGSPARLEGFRSQTAVKRVRVVGVDQLESRSGPGGVAGLLPCLRCPVEVRRSVVGAGKHRGGAIEHLGRFGVLLLPVGPPADLPHGARGVSAGRKSRDDLPEDDVGLIVFVGDNVERREVVERVLGPRAVREVADKRPRQLDVLVAAPDALRRHHVEEPGLRSAGRPVEERRQVFADPAEPLQEVIRLGHPKLHEFCFVAGGHGSEPLEGLARRSVAALGEQALGTCQLAREPGRPRGDRPERRERHLVLGCCRGLARRPVEVERLVGVERPRAVARACGGPRQAQQDVIGRRGFQRERFVVERHRGGVIALGRADFGQLERGGLGEVAGRAGGPKRLKGPTGGLETLEFELGQARQVRRVSGERGARQRRRPDEGERLGVFFLVDQPGGLSERAGRRYGICARSRPSRSRDEPVVGHAERQRRVRGRARSSRRAWAMRAAGPWAPAA